MLKVSNYGDFWDSCRSQQFDLCWPTRKSMAWATWHFTPQTQLYAIHRHFQYVIIFKHHFLVLERCPMLWRKNVEHKTATCLKITSVFKKAKFPDYLVSLQILLTLTRLESYEIIHVEIMPVVGTYYLILRCEIKIKYYQSDGSLFSCIFPT